MQLPTPPGWGQWQQNEVETSYVVHMDSQMMGTQAPLQQPTMSPHYAVSMAPSPSLHQPLSYAPFSHGLPAVAPHMATMTTHHQQPQHQQHHHQFADSISSRPRRKLVDSRGFRDFAREDPETRQERRSTPEKPVRKVPKTIVANAPAEGALDIGNHVEFHTPMDKLMKAIQSIPETKTLVESVEAVVKEESAVQQDTQQPPSPFEEQKSGVDKPATRKFACVFRNCQKKFAQKAQLDTHVRAHTGEKPYVCEYPNCGKRFSQSGNLHTHERKHTGERPYACDICGRRFAQGGNRQAHEKTHQKTKDFVCRLENCGKEFTQRGNLKNHQNKSHKLFIQRFEAELERTAPENITDEQRRLIAYLGPIFKNSNKGIKGRGSRPSDCHMGRSARSSSFSSSTASYSPTTSEASSTPSPSTAGPPTHLHQHYGYSAHQPQPQPQLQPQPQPQQQQQQGHHAMAPYHAPTSAPMHHQHQHRPQNGLAFPPVSFGSAPTGNIRYPFDAILHHNHYEMSDPVTSYAGVPVTTASSSSSPVATVYSDDSGPVYHSDDNSSRELAFGERMC